MLHFNQHEKNIALKLRAEVVVAALVEKEVPFDSIRYEAKGSFKKNYSNDIEKIEVQSASNVLLSVNRDGLYDRLPEGLFHQTRMQKNSTLTDMVAEHKRYKSEEKSARKFFRPIEQELFRYSVLIEQEERRLTNNLFDATMLQLFQEFWMIDSELPKEPSTMLIRLMPWVATIKGNPELTKKALSLILNKPVDFEEKLIQHKIETKQASILGNNALGMDSVLGQDVTISVWNWVFKIKGIPADDMYAYTSQKPYAQLLKKFEEIFIPLEVDVLFDYEVSTTAPSKNISFVLGYSFTI